MKKFSYDGRTNIIGERVRQAREKLGLNQTALAAQLEILHVKIDRNAISKIELNDRIVTDYELLNLAKVLKVDIVWLLTGDK